MPARVGAAHVPPLECLALDLPTARELTDCTCKQEQPWLSPTLEMGSQKLRGLGLGLDWTGTPQFPVVSARPPLGAWASGLLARLLWILFSLPGLGRASGRCMECPHCRLQRPEMLPWYQCDCSHKIILSSVLLCLGDSPQHCHPASRPALRGPCCYYRKPPWRGLRPGQQVP